MKSLRFFLHLGLLFISLIASADSQTSIQFDFKQKQTIYQWKIDGAASISKGDDGVKITSKDKPATADCVVTLAPNHYVLYGKFEGRIEFFIRKKDANGAPDVAHFFFELKKPGPEYYDFDISEKTQGELVVSFTVQPGETTAIEWIKIESPPEVEGDPSVLNKILDQSREVPPPLMRGFMVGGSVSMDQTIKKNIKDAQEWGANILRVPLCPKRFAASQKKTLWESWPEYLKRITDVVKYSESIGVKLVLELHEPPVENIQRDQPELWNHPDLTRNFVKVWVDIATACKPYHQAIWGYDIYNEPLDRQYLPWAPKGWYPLALAMVREIRKIDPDVWIVYEPGPGGMSRGIYGLLPLPDRRIVYSVHDYAPGKFTHQGVGADGDLFQGGDLTKYVGVKYPTMEKGVLWDKEAMLKGFQPVVDFQKKWNVPIFIGEFSVIRWAPRDDAVQWLKDNIDMFEANGWTWCYHAFREWPGWSLEHDETFWKNGMPTPKPVSGLTERAKVVRSYLERNKKSASE